VSSRRLVVNADDFGRSRGINRGVVEAYDNGIVTSASLMSLWPASRDAASEAARRPGLGVGLHFDAGEWLYANGMWHCVYLRVPLDDRRAITAELDRQLRAFRRLLGRDPDHLDSHQHVHRSEPARSVLAEAAAVLGVPSRHCSGHVRYLGDFYGKTGRGTAYPQAITVEGLLTTLAGLREGVSELGCHPGYATDVATDYRSEREREVRTLCDLRVRAAVDLAEIELATFTDVAALMA
jgi:chitin disaccharide deacetylase